ncbi:MAG: hypothetical protein ACLGIB_11780 [Actinomycetota bacterium]
MRSRLIVLLSLALVYVFALSPVASAAPLNLAQAESDEGADQSDPGTDTGGGESTGEGDAGEEGGEGDPEAEVGADEGQEGATEEEEGPQWTYQMSRITLVMLLLLFLALGALYYRMITKRQSGA